MKVLYGRSGHLLFAKKVTKYGSVDTFNTSTLLLLVVGYSTTNSNFTDKT